MQTLLILRFCVSHPHAGPLDNFLTLISVLGIEERKVTSQKFKFVNYKIGWHIQKEQDEKSQNISLLMQIGGEM